LAAFHFLVLQPLEARNAQLMERLARQAPQAQAGQAGSAADKVGAVYAFLQKEEETTDWLAKLHGIGAATGVQLKSASYRTRKTEGRIVRYEMVLPLAGSYPQIRDFLKRSLAEIPVMSVDQLTLRRESRNDGAVQAELRLTLHMVSS
jgi:Tfp pilus assembly protein PilO